MTKTKKILASLLAFAIVLTILPASLLASAAVTYNDAQLLQMFGYNPDLVSAVKTAALKPIATSLEDTDLAGITTLTYDGSATGKRPLTSIPTAGFDTLKGLQTLNLPNNRLASLSGFTSNNRLSITTLNVSGNSILTDIGGVSTLTNLTNFDVSNCALTNINGVSSLTLLRTLIANNNKITSMYPVYNCKVLDSANFANNGITRIEGLTNLTYLNYLNLSNNKITRIEGLNLTNNSSYPGPISLGTLNLTNNVIKTIDTNSCQLLSIIPTLSLTGNSLPKSELVKVPFANNAATATAVVTQLVITVRTSIPTEVAQSVIFNQGSNGIVIDQVTFNSTNGTYVETPVTAYTISSSDPTVATVSKHSANSYYTVNPVKVGTFDYILTVGGVSTVLQSARVSSNLTSSITINDKQNPNIAINSQKLLTVTLTSGLQSNSQVEWISSNPSILTVTPNSNTVAATVQSYGLTGTATITAKVLDGSNKSDSITITVVNPVTAISLNSPKTKMTTDETQNLSVAYTPSNATYKNVSYKSSNEMVATVDGGGVVTAKTPGTTTITATTTGNDYPRSTYFTLTVTDGDLTIKLDKKSTKIYIDQEVKVTAKITPTYLSGDKITWKSDDSSVVSVDSDGVMIGRKVGKTTITAKYSKNGETVGAYIDIEVVNPSVKVTLDDYNITLKPEQTYDIDYSVTPTDLPNRSVSFASNNEDVAAVTNEGMIIAGIAGKATITVRSQYNSKYVARVTVTVAPSTPSLSVKKSGTTATLTAGTSNGATKYRYYVKTKTSDSYKKISDTSSKTFKVTNLKADQIYYFAVRTYVTVDGKNIYSGYKKVTLNPVVATPKFTYTKSGNAITLKVTNPPKGAKYVYYMKYEPNETFFRISDGTTKTSFTEKDLVKGEYYYFTVRQYKTYSGKNVYSKTTTLKVKI